MTRRVVGLTAGLILMHLVLHVALGLGREAPDLFVVALLLASRSMNVRSAAALGMLLGLLEDAYSMTSFGSNVLAMTVLGMAGAKSRDLFVGDSKSFLATFFLLGAWLRIAIVWAVTESAVRPDLDQRLLVESVLMALYAASCGILLRLLFLRGGRAS
ncbi:MAG: rod shape-determining protein MreD [Gemmatimonadetes bacterium]|nr:rod shape-determining protein MreD [Gemmatimonadota bacterium]